jgi:hypothetical protein
LAVVDPFEQHSKDHWFGVWKVDRFADNMWNTAAVEKERRTFGQEKVVDVEAQRIFERADVEGDGLASAGRC